MWPNPLPSLELLLESYFLHCFKRLNCSLYVLWSSQLRCYLFLSHSSFWLQIYTWRRALRRTFFSPAAQYVCMCLQYCSPPKAVDKVCHLWGHLFKRLVVILMKMNAGIDLTLEETLVIPNWVREKRIEETASKVTVLQWWSLHREWSPMWKSHLAEVS